MQPSPLVTDASFRLLFAEDDCGADSLLPRLTCALVCDRDSWSWFDWLDLSGCALASPWLLLPVLNRRDRDALSCTCQSFPPAVKFPSFGMLGRAEGMETWLHRWLGSVERNESSSCWWLASERRL